MIIQVFKVKIIIMTMENDNRNADEFRKLFIFYERFYKNGVLEKRISVFSFLR